MKKLGIRLEKSQHSEEDALGLSYPHLAFAYYRSGFITLAARKRSRAK